jgi:hypothetical protein
MPAKKSAPAKADLQASRTAVNKANKAKRHVARMARFAERTDALVGSRAKVRTAESGKSVTGTVLAVIRKGDESYPTDARRSSGAYLKVRTSHGEKIISRHRIKPIREAV